MPIFYTILALAAMTSPAYAYIDPASSSMVLQVIVGGIAAAGMAIKMAWGKISAFFSKVSQRKDR